MTSDSDKLPPERTPAEKAARFARLYGFHEAIEALKPDQPACGELSRTTAPEKRKPKKPGERKTP